MADIKLLSNAEKKAEIAETLSAFSGLKLLHVKKELTKILGMIGRDGIFDEYTKHDISHIDYMLDSLDWIIPEKTQNILTPADWMMIVLSIYFHDLGMLVTKDEYREKDTNDSFSIYKKDVFDAKYGIEFLEKINKLETDNKERFLYQEFVRKTHAERIKYWIIGEKASYQKNELTASIEIRKLINPVLIKFRRDLAMICESHHLNDLDNFEKYRVDQPYGIKKEEIVNLHYVALILRTSDLLHITSDRTPTIEFYLINPSDPKSQEEWCKQKAVLQVRPQAKKDKDGNIDEAQPKDTFEIIASFEDENGFFGLVAYLDFALKQLKNDFNHNQQANKKHGAKFEFPWNNIDDSKIEAINFMKRPFEFILDQPKILDLLVGHTLYNDSTVVLRELSQNSIDAVKLQKYAYEMDGNHSYKPKVLVEWNPSINELSFIDNGTGMSLEIIENHLLKVGSSRYQSAEFKKKYPDFTPISRFGIGLLTCFLIANDIDIITKDVDSEKALILRIKKVHGKYLLKYINTDEINPLIKEHGTIVKLYVRSNIDLENIENDLKKWVLIPNCAFSLKVDDVESIIGYNNLTEILIDYLKQIGYDVDNKDLKVEEKIKDGVSIAFALRYIEHFKEWKFLEFRDVDKNNAAPIGTCIEGIRIDFNTPGFVGRNIICIANATGKYAPKTNVARSNIELTTEREALLYSIYYLYLNHIEKELTVLYTNNGFSLSWAAYEANFLIQSFLKPESTYNEKNIRIEDFAILERAVAEIKCLLFEFEEKRILLSIKDIIERKSFWTIDCALYNSADSLIKEIPTSNASALSLLNSLISKEKSHTEHIDNLFCNFRTGNIIEQIVSNQFQVDAIKIFPDQRRLDLRWAHLNDKLWEQIEIDNEFGNERSKCYIQLKEIEFDNLINQTAIKSTNVLYILKDSELNNYLVDVVKKLSTNLTEDKIVLSRVVSLLNSFFYYKDLDKTKIEEIIENIFERSNFRNIGKLVWSKISKEDLISTVMKTKFIKYDTTIWYRRMGW